MEALDTREQAAIPVSTEIQIRHGNFGGEGQQEVPVVAQLRPQKARVLETKPGKICKSQVGSYKPTPIESTAREVVASEHGIGEITAGEIAAGKIAVIRDQSTNRHSQTGIARTDSSEN